MNRWWRKLVPRSPACSIWRDPRTPRGSLQAGSPRKLSQGLTRKLSQAALHNTYEMKWTGLGISELRVLGLGCNMVRIRPIIIGCIGQMEWPDTHCLDTFDVSLGGPVLTTLDLSESDRRGCLSRCPHYHCCVSYDKSGMSASASFQVTVLSLIAMVQSNLPSTCLKCLKC